jgi:drug/metabolite transporter (DMT)-like permease
MNTPSRDDTVHGIFMMACAGLTIALLWAVLRYASDYMHPLYIVFWRSLFGALVLVPWVMRQGTHVMHTKRLPLHFARSITGFTAMIGIFYSVAHIPLAQAMAINYSGPLFATLGAVLIFGEVLKVRRVAALMIGFIGVLMVLQPSVDSFNWGMAAALLGAASMAASMLLIRSLGQTENNAAIVIYGNTLSLPLALVLALVFWEWPTVHDWILLVVIGVMSTIAQLFMNRALTVAETSAVIPIDFLRLVFVSILGALLFAQPIDEFMWLGGAIILCSSVYIARRESLS